MFCVGNGNGLEILEGADWWWWALQESGVFMMRGLTKLVEEKIRITDSERGQRDIVKNLDKQVEFHRDDDNVLWQDTRLVVPNDASLRVKIEHQRASGLLQPLNIPVWKWDEISMDFVTGLPQTQRRHDAIWVVVDRLTKSAHFLPIRKDYSVSRLAEIF
nr:retrotransposon protein, putative, Ty3-gypsy subclass [Tanacetum cinerariifolium]